MPRTRSLAWSELKIGVLAVAALVLTAILVMAVGGASGFSWQRYEIKTSFVNVQGLKAGAIVRIAGVEVGKVTKVELAGAGVDVFLSIKEENQSRVTTESYASIGAMSLLGEPLIDVSPSAAGTPLKDGDVIKSKKPASQLSDVAETANEGDRRGHGAVEGHPRGQGVGRQAVHRGQAVPGPERVRRLGERRHRVDQPEQGHPGQVRQRPEGLQRAPGVTGQPDRK